MTKKLLLIVLLVTVKMNAQTYMGFIPDNYAGIQGVLFNPASIADSRFRADINLFSTSSSLNNDYYGVSLFELPSDSYDFDNEAIVTPKKNNGGILYSDVLGTAFMFNIAPKHTVALYTRARAIVNGSDINGELFDQFEGGLDTANDFLIDVGDPRLVGQTWAEVGATYAAVLWQNNNHFIKGGVTAKYLLGGINSYVDGYNISAAFNQTGDPNTSALVTTGTMTIGSSQDFITGDEDVKFDSDSNGFGADIGLVYEWRPDNVSDAKNLNKYKLRFGFSVTDIGQITYKNMKQDTYNINGIVTQQELEDFEFDDLGDFLESHYGAPVTVYKDSKSNLPTMMHVDADWNINGKFYLNATGNLSLVESGMNKTYAQNSWMITPRYETKWFTAALPVNYMEFTGMQIGTSLRFGPLFVGSSSVITNLMSKESKGADVFFGVKIPIYQN